MRKRQLSFCWGSVSINWPHCSCHRVNMKKKLVSNFDNTIEVRTYITHNASNLDFLLSVKDQMLTLRPLTLHIRFLHGLFWSPVCCHVSASSAISAPLVFGMQWLASSQAPTLYYFVAFNCFVHGNTHFPFPNPLTFLFSSSNQRVKSQFAWASMQVCHNALDDIDIGNRCRSEC